ncbi:MAG: PAS domain-containing protein [Humidesulfovibrio sp.]|nr:PAS domain-containing protein [Humidesulfovibrio sp.]
MTVPNDLPRSLPELAAEALAQGVPVQDAAAPWLVQAEERPFPAALLDSGLVYLAANKSYARLLQLPPAAFVGKEYSRVHRLAVKTLARPTDDLALLHEAVSGGQALGLPLPVALEGPDGQDYRWWTLSPLRGPEGQVRGLVLEFFPDDPGAKTRAAEQ